MSVTSTLGGSVVDPAGSALDIRYVRELPARPGEVVDWPDWLPVDSVARAAAGRIGVSALWAHQVRAADTLHDGRHVVLTTGTASGKSLAYLLPIAAAATGPAPSVELGDLTVRTRRRPATSLYLAPTKALAHDQARVCAELAVPGWRVATVDGDTDRADRQWARDHAHHVLTNPDLVHASLLPNHARWASFLRSLRFVVVDESHRYRGVFGAQVAAVLRRLRRVAAHYGADPAFAVLSATSAEPIAAAAALTGVAASELTLVDEDASPRGRVTISVARSLECSPEEAAARELAERVGRGQQVLAFVPSRRGAEEVARSAAVQLRATRPVGVGTVGGDSGGGSEIVAYRAGYLAHDRRVVERGLANGTIRGVAATNALELGVDIAGLDTVVVCGYPGNRAAFWQQAGRAGRRGGAAEVLLIARPNPLDAYLLDHPDALFDQPIESPVLDPDAAPVLGPQLAAAAQELPLRPGDERWFGASTWPLVDKLTAGGVLRRRPDGWYWTAPRRAVDRINLRTADARNVEIIEEATGRVLGTVSASAADQTVHPGAVYLHQGDTYVCDELVCDELVCEEPVCDEPVCDEPADGELIGGDAAVRGELIRDELIRDNGLRIGDVVGEEPSIGDEPGAGEIWSNGAGMEAYVHAARPGYLTQPLADVDVRPGPSEHRCELGTGQVELGPVRVTTRVTGFLRRDEVSGQVWDSTPLDCPERVLVTTAVVLTLTAATLSADKLPADALSADALSAEARPSRGRARREAALHAVEHLLVGLLPAIASNDRGDVGAHSWLGEDDRGVIVVFDQQPGSGFTARAYERLTDWLVVARDRIDGCTCASGCPACILLPGCSSTRPLDKDGARRLLASLVAHVPG